MPKYRKNKSRDKHCSVIVKSPINNLNLKGQIKTKAFNEDVAKRLEEMQKQLEETKKEGKQ